MKMHIFLAIVLAMAMPAHAQKTPQGVTYDAKIVRVNDGDTVVISAPFLPAPLKPELPCVYMVLIPRKKGFVLNAPRKISVDRLLQHLLRMQ